MKKKTVMLMVSIMVASSSFLLANQAFAQNYYEEYVDDTTRSRGGVREGTPYRGNMIHGPTSEEQRVHGKGSTIPPPGAGYDASGTPYRGNMIYNDPPKARQGIGLKPVPDTTSPGTPHRGNMYYGPTREEARVLGKGPVGGAVKVINSGTPYRGNYKH